tara:strand:+ start:1954 stop:3546 length:1593 start_codon:yes stop_codon:yes gene_type:complete
MAEGYTGGGPGGAATNPNQSSRFGMRNGGATSAKPVLEKTKSVSYSAATSNQILAISQSASSTSTGESIPKRIEIENDGRVPIVIMAGYREWTSATADAGSAEGTFEYLHIMLMPGETFLPPVRSVIRTGETDGTQSKVQMLGTASDNAVPDGNMYVAISDCQIDGAGLASGTTATTFDVDNGAGSPAAAVGFFRVGDLIRIENEILEVTAIAANTGTEAQLTVKRGVHGSTAATHADNTAIRLPFFNTYHDFNKYSVAQTDSDGKFKCTNFFGLGRANSGVQGITPGSIALKFYNPGYQAFGLSGITGSTHSGLAASTEYKFNITVDGGSTFANLTFTTDSTNLNFGGSNGIVRKIQDALDTQFYTSGNLFEKKVTVGIVDGDIRFTSGSHLSGSIIELAAPSSGTTPFGVGRFPAIGDIHTKVAAKLPDDVTYDRVTYESIPNQSAFMYDDGNGNLFGAASGTINYETGAIDFHNAPVNAEFVCSCIHTSAFSGKLNEGTAERINSLVDIYVNTPSQKWNGSVKVRTY